MTESELLKLRGSISAIDQELIQIFAKRRQLSLKVAEAKYKANRDIRDFEQEKNLLTNLTKEGLDSGIPVNTTLSLFHNIIEDSVRAQYDYFLEQELNSPNKKIHVALLGEKDSYSHIATENHFSRKLHNVRLTHCSSFIEIFQHVSNDSVDIGLVPIENTTSGNITEVFDLLLEYDLNIIGEEKLKVKHCLIATHNASLDKITDVYSHPQAIAQCKSFFSENPRINSHYRSSTSSAMKMIDEYQNPQLAAIGSEQAAQRYGLKVLKYGINNYQENYTRFLLISKSPITVPEKVPAKTSIVINTEQKAGALVECLLILKEHQINMTKLESRPIPTQPWKEMFYIDFEGNIKDSNVDSALMKLTAVAHHIKVIGCYPKHDIIATKLDVEHIKHQEKTA